MLQLQIIYLDNAPLRLWNIDFSKNSYNVACKL